MITADAREFWAAVAKRPDWKQYILPKRTDDEFDQEGKQQADDILRLCPLKGGTVIEYGCGIGRISRHMAQHADRMVGLDICEAFLEKARERDAASEYVLSDMFNEEEVADLVYSVAVMQHNTRENQHRIMARVFALLKRRGACLITFAHGPVYREGKFIHKFSEGEVRELASAFAAVTVIKSNLVRYARHTIADKETNELVLLAERP